MLRLGIRREPGRAGERESEKAALLLGKSMAENRDDVRVNVYVESRGFFFGCEAGEAADRKSPVSRRCEITM